MRSMPELVEAAPLGWLVNLLNSPADGARCGGDWCDAFAIARDCVAVSIGDVSGHGEAAAETMRVMRLAVASAIYQGVSPSSVLSVANTAAHACGDEIIVTATVAVLDRRRLTLTFANAGHPPPLMITSAGDGFLSSDVCDLPLGVLRRYRASDYVVALPKEAMLVFYTDGIVEHRRDYLRGERELIDACRAVYELPAGDAAYAIAQRIFQDGRGHDDASILTLRSEASAAS